MFHEKEFTGDMCFPRREEEDIALNRDPTPEGKKVG